MSKVTTTILSPGTLVRFDDHKDVIGRVMGVHIGAANVVTYEIEWDSDEKGSYVSHTFSPDRVRQLEVDSTTPIQIGFGGTHPEQLPVVVKGAK